MKTKTLVQKDFWSRDVVKFVAIAIGVALLVPLIETLMGRPLSRREKGNPHAKPPFPVEQDLEAKPGYE